MITADETPSGYQAKLRATMANPGEAMQAACNHCGRSFLIRLWPGNGDEDDQPYLDAFLDGLAELARITGSLVFGFWALVPGREPVDEDTPVQLWRANDRTLVFTGTHFGAVRETGRHRCPSAN